MSMELGDTEIVSVRDLVDSIEVFMPDTEARSRTAHVGPIRSSRSESRIDPDAYRRTRSDFPILLELMEAARIEYHPLVEELRKKRRKLLRSELNMITRNACPHGSESLIPTTRVDMDTICVKES